MNQLTVKKQQISFLAGILSVLCIISFRSSLGYAGMGYVTFIFECACCLWCLLGQGSEEAVSKMLKARFSRGQRENGQLVWKYTRRILPVCALLGSLLLAVGLAFSLKNIFGMSHVYTLCWLIAPLFFFRVLSEMAGGYAGGKNADGLVCLGYLFRPILLFILGKYFIPLFHNKGLLVSALLLQNDFEAIYGAMGLLVAATVTELVILIYYGVLCLLSSGTVSDDSLDGYKGRETFQTVLGGLLNKRGALQFQNTLWILPLPVAFLFVVAKATDLHTFAENYGLFFTGAFLTAGLFLLLAYFLVLPLLAKSNYFFSKKENKGARRMFHYLFHITIVVGLFFTCYMVALGDSISFFIEPLLGNEIKGFVAMIGFSLVFSFVNIILQRLLFLRGRFLIPSLIYIVYSICSILLFSYMFQKEMDACKAMSYTWLVGQILLCLALVVAVMYQLGVTFDPIRCIAVPLGCGLLAAIINMFLAKIMSPHLGNIFTMILCFFEMLLLYFFFLLMLRNINENEIKGLPGSHLIEALGQLMHAW